MGWSSYQEDIDERHDDSLRRLNDNLCAGQDFVNKSSQDVEKLDVKILLDALQDTIKRARTEHKQYHEYANKNKALIKLVNQYGEDIFSNYLQLQGSYSLLEEKNKNLITNINSLKKDLELAKERIFKQNTSIIEASMNRNILVNNGSSSKKSKNSLNIRTGNIRLNDKTATNLANTNSISKLESEYQNIQQDLVRVILTRDDLLKRLDILSKAINILRSRDKG